MKGMMKKALTAFLVALMFSCSLTPPGEKDQEDPKHYERAVSSVNRAPSSNPPGGLQPYEVPMFVTFGFDDNGNGEGMQWALDLFQGRTNPAGSGNAATFDGTPVSVSFYNCTYYATNWSGVEIKKKWRAAYEAGHEIGNHTKTHGHGQNYSTAQWTSEIDETTAFLAQPYNPAETTLDNTKGIGVPAAEITGFRTPYLEYNNNLFSVLKARDMYDCSIEEGFQYLQDGTDFLWPYTLDNGSPGHDVQVEWGSKQAISPVPGLWEMPVYTVIVPPELRESMKTRQTWFDVGSGKITGFDYNLWVSFNMTKAEFVATLKHTLDLRLMGNRAPLMIGAHTDYYSAAYTAPRGSTAAERKAAVQEFLDYAQSKSAVRVVSIDRILQWVKNPVAIPGSTQYTVTPAAGANGTIEPSTPVSLYSGQSTVFKLTPAAGYMVDQVLVDGVAVDVSMNEVKVAVADANRTISATFKQVSAGEACRITYYWTYDYHDEPVDMNTPMVDLKDLAGQVIATVPEALAKRISMEGSGFIPDGRLLNLANSSDWPGARFFEVDQTVAPWGYDSNGQALIPWKSAAVDPAIIPVGSNIFIEEFYGKVLPDGTVHDGWFYASDTSHSFHGFWVDIFTGTYPNYIQINEDFGHLNVMTVSGTTSSNPSYSVIASAGPNGTIAPEGSTLILPGDSRNYFFKPAAGYSVDTVTVDGVQVNFDPVNNNYYMPNVNSNKTIHVTFKSGSTIPVDYTITKTASAGGTIAGPDKVAAGSSATFTFTPDAGYSIQSVTVNGTSVQVVNNSYTIPSVNANTTVSVTFSQIVGPVYYTITASAVNGTITGPNSVQAGSSATFDFAPDAGYTLKEVLVNNAVVATTGSSYTIPAVNADTSIKVVFEQTTGPGAMAAVYTIDQDWGTGFGATVVVKNNGTSAVSSWTVTMTYSGNQTVSGWNGNFSQSGNVVTVTNLSWNGSLQAGGTVSFGMNGSYTGTNDIPVIIVK